MIQIKWVGHPRSWGQGRSHAVTCLIMHNTEGQEGPGTAQAGHNYDVQRTDGTSCHVFVDSKEALQEVEWSNTAYAAFYHGNGMGVQIEMCHPGEWNLNDPIDAATFDNAAQVAAQLCIALKLPAVWLNKDQARAAWFGTTRGITGHAEITQGFPEDGGDHYDPRSSFPRAEFVKRVAVYMSGAPAGLVGGGKVMRFVFGAAVGGDGRSVYVTDGLRYRIVPQSYKVDGWMTSSGAGPIVTVNEFPATTWTLPYLIGSLCGTLDPGELAGEGGDVTGEDTLSDVEAASVNEIISGSTVTITPPVPGDGS